MNEDDLDRRLRAADRMSGVEVTDPVLDRVHAATRDAATRRPTRRFSLIAGVTVFALGGAVAAPTMADTVEQWIATAGWQPAPQNELVPGSETVDLLAEDAPEYIASRYPEWLPLPPGTTREQIIDEVVDDWMTMLAEQGPAAHRYTQEVGFRYSYEQHAICGWVATWATSDDAADIARATEVFREAGSWPALTEYEEALGEHVDAGESIRALAVAAESGDEPGVRRAAWVLACDSAVAAP